MTLVGVATALSLAAPASAEPVDTSFLNALNDAGISYGDPVSTEKLGQSICPMLVEPGKNLASVYSTVSDNGINPDVAAFFTGIAISAYCPSMMANIGNGTILEGLNGLPGLSALGIPGF